MTDFQLQRLGKIMEPEPGNPLEVEGVLNPAAIRGHDGALYLFPRLVARGNYSRIGIARVLFNGAGEPFGVERLGVVLEPETDYEMRAGGGGGCEDPRITFVEPLRQYVMTYTAASAGGPTTRISGRSSVIARSVTRVFDHLTLPAPSEEMIRPGMVAHLRFLPVAGVSPGPTGCGEPAPVGAGHRVGRAGKGIHVRLIR